MLLNIPKELNELLSCCCLVDIFSIFILYVLIRKDSHLRYDTVITIQLNQIKNIHPDIKSNLHYTTYDLYIYKFLC